MTNEYCLVCGQADSYRYSSGIGITDVAIHEAGHALVAVRQGRSVKRVYLRPSESAEWADNGGMMEHGQRRFPNEETTYLRSPESLIAASERRERDDIAIRIAGLAAQQELLPVGHPQASWEGCDEDLIEAWRVATQHLMYTPRNGVVGGNQQRIIIREWRLVKRMLHRDRDLLLVLAEELEVHRELEGKYVRSIVHNHDSEIRNQRAMERWNAALRQKAVA